MAVFPNKLIRNRLWNIGQCLLFSKKRDGFKIKKQRRRWKIRKKEREWERKGENRGGKERRGKNREAVVGRERIQEWREWERGRKIENEGERRDEGKRETIRGRRKKQRGQEATKEEKERLTEEKEWMREKKEKMIEGNKESEGEEREWGRKTRGMREERKKWGRERNIEGTKGEEKNNFRKKSRKGKKKVDMKIENETGGWIGFFNLLFDSSITRHLKPLAKLVLGT
jgi:hypothetical protein